MTGNWNTCAMLRSAVGSSGHVRPVEEDAALARRDQPGDDVEERGLAAAGRAEQRIGAAILPDVVRAASAHSPAAPSAAGRRRGRHCRGRCAPSPPPMPPPASGRAPRRARRRRRRRRSGSDRDRAPPAGRCARSCTPCASATQRSPAKSTWMKLSEPVISVSATRAGHRHRVGPGPTQEQMVGPEAERVGAVRQAGERGRRPEASGRPPAELSTAAGLLHARAC